MKRLALITLTILCVAWGSAFAQDIGTQVQSGMEKFFAANHLTLAVKIDVIKELKNPKGIAFIKITFKDPKSGRTQSQYSFTDGKYLIPDFVSIDSNTSMKDTLIFNNAKKVDFDMSKLSYVEGDKNAKHVLITVSDFQCPYCKRAYVYLHNEIKRRHLDVAIYMLHLPLPFHPKSMIYAKIFEAGKMMGKNFAEELYATNEKFSSQKDDAIITHFATETGNPAKFRELLKSPAIVKKINEDMQLAHKLGISGTPHVYFDGKPVDGFKESMYDLGLDSFK